MQFKNRFSRYNHTFTFTQMLVDFADTSASSESEILCLKERVDKVLQLAIFLADRMPDDAKIELSSMLHYELKKDAEEELIPTDLILVTSGIGTITSWRVLGRFDNFYIARFTTGTITAVPAEIKVLDKGGDVLAAIKEDFLAVNKWANNTKYLIEIPIVEL